MIKETLFQGVNVHQQGLEEYAQVMAALIPGYKVTGCPPASGPYRLVVMGNDADNEAPQEQQQLVREAQELTALTDKVEDLPGWTVFDSQTSLPLLARWQAMAMTIQTDTVKCFFSLQQCPAVWQEQLLEVVTERLRSSGVPYPGRVLSKETFLPWTLMARRMESSVSGKHADASTPIPVLMQPGGMMEAGEEWGLQILTLPVKKVSLRLSCDEAGQVFLHLPPLTGKKPPWSSSSSSSSSSSLQSWLQAQGVQIATPEPAILADPRFPHLNQLLLNGPDWRPKLAAFAEAARVNDAEYLPCVEYPLLRARYYQQAIRDLQRLYPQAKLNNLKPPPLMLNKKPRLLEEDGGLLVNEFKPLVPYLEVSLPPVEDDAALLKREVPGILERFRLVGRLGHQARLRESKHAFI